MNNTKKGIFEFGGYPIVDREKDYYSGFIEELCLLPYNSGFQKAIKALRIKWRITQKELDKQTGEPSLEEWKKIYSTNEDKIADILPIADRCRIGKGKFRAGLVESIMTYAMFDSPFIPWQYSEKPLTFEPQMKLELDSKNKVIRLNIDIYSDTTLADVFRVLKNYWPVIKNLRSKIKIPKIKAMKNFFRDLRIWGSTSNLSVADIYDQIPENIPDSEIMQPNSIYKIKNRFDKRIKDSYSDK